LTVLERLEIFNAVLNAIAHAHREEIIHRDIAPNNVLRIEGVWMVADFGLGKDYSEQTHGGYSTVADHGQILYAAPEQSINLKDATSASDVYSLGKLLYFILTGKSPLFSHKASEFSKVIEKATSEDAEDRYKNAIEMQEDFFKEWGYYNTLSSPQTYYETLAEYLEEVSNSEFSWLEFYRVILEKRVKDHIYHDFISPILTKLSTPESIRQFILQTPVNLLDFVKTMRKAFEKCSHLTRWPFSDTYRFGDLMYNIYKISDDEEVKLDCLEELWIWLAVREQWDVQSIFISFIENEVIPQRVAHELAMLILRRGSEFDKLNNLDFSKIHSRELANALKSVK